MAVLTWSRGNVGVLAALVVVAALSAAALSPALRLPLLVALVVALLLVPRGSAWRWALAAGVPVAAIFTWNSAVADRLTGGVACADVWSPLAWSRVAEAALVIVLVLALARLTRTSLLELGLRRPTRTEAWLGLGALVLIPIPSLLLGALLAEPFFGSIRLDLGQPAALVPALLLAVSNGTMEELAYRGAAMRWLTRAGGPTIGLVGQAVVFGAAHTGPDFVGPVLPVVLAIMAAGVVAGVIVRRSGSLWFVIAAHIAFDVPLYYAAACRLG